jgi:hypothetical protein
LALLFRYYPARGGDCRYFGKLIIEETEKWANVRASSFSEIRLPLDIP